MADQSAPGHDGDQQGLLVTPQGMDRLGPGQRFEVLTLVQAATDADQVAPLSEQVLLAVGESGSRSGRRRPGTSGTSSSGHFLAHAGKRLAGYAHLGGGMDGEPATVELVVAPSHRRRGVGTALLRAVEAAWASRRSSSQAPLHIWSHGDLPDGRAFVLDHGYTPVRELWQMRRPLAPDAPPLPVVDLPEGFRARTFVVGQDEQAWLRVNARAFVDHQEQGRMTRQDLDRRIAEPWFDPKGFILIEDLLGPHPVLAASHWTKVVPGPPEHAAEWTEPTDETSGPAKQGEVYVVGVDPAYQGKGLGRSATVLGLAHLRDTGLTEATLYVDADNRAAVSTYSRLGFAPSAVDIMYSRLVHLPV